MTVSGPAIDVAEAERQLQRVLRSRVFERAQRSQRFLRYLVEAALAQPPIPVKEYTIAIDVFDRDTSYDPSVDATVRVEASRLRSRLREYYSEEGQNEPLVIEVPKGSYAAVLHTRTMLPTAVGELPTPEAMAATAGPAPATLGATAPQTWKLRGYIAAAVIMAIAVCGLTIWHYAHPPRQSAAFSVPVSLAVLPISNKTGDPRLDYVTDGFTDDLIRQLSQVPALTLIARSTMFRYRSRSGDAPGVAKALHVQAVVAGELRHRAEHNFLAVEVSRTSDGSVLLDREYIADDEDLRAVQAEVQHDLLEKLDVEGSALDPKKMLHSVTSNPQAYEEFLEGDALVRNGSPAEMHQALDHFEKATQLDPQFDLAWSAMASGHVMLGMFFERPEHHMPLARSFAEHALQINPMLGEAHGSLGLVDLAYDWNLPASEAEMQTAGAEQAAISILPCTAHLIELAGEPRSAEEMLERMLGYDPESSTLKAELGCVDFYRGRLQSALRHYHESLSADPESPIAYWGIGKTLNAEGRHGEAVAVLQSFRQRNGFQPPLLTAELGYALGAQGDRRGALGQIHQLAETSKHIYVDPYLTAVVYASLNDRADAFAWLNKAIDVRSGFAISLPTEPKWEPFRADPRFAKLLQRMKLT